MSALAKARASLSKVQGLGHHEETLEEKLIKMDSRNPPLSLEQTIALQAAEIAAGDWGPVFVYGQMLSQQAWCALIGRVPDMKPCWVRGWERREILRSTCAGLIKNNTDSDMLTVGQAVFALMPWERRLLDETVDDGFQLIDVTIQALDDLSIDIDATTYIWRESKFPDAIGKDDWAQDIFQSDHESHFTDLCADILTNFGAKSASDEDLKEKALKRRRDQTGFEDDVEWKADEEEEEAGEDIDRDEEKGDS